MNQTFIVPPESRDAAIAKLADFLRVCWPGKRIKVEWSEAKDSRTLEQNNLLFGVLYPPIAEAMGYEVDGDNGIHAFMCGTHFGWVDVKVPKTPRNPDGIASEPRRSTTRAGWHHGKRDVLSKAEFSKFIDTVDRIASHAGVYLPLDKAA